MASRRRPFHRLLVLVLGLTLILGGSLAGSTRAQRPAFVTANGYVLQQGSLLPIYRFNPPVVSPTDTTNPLAQRFEGIYERQEVAEEIYLGRPRYSVVNEERGALLTQYGATGGFYAFNLGGIAPEAPVGKVNPGQAQSLACSFLLTNNFIAGDGSVLIGGQQPQGVVSPNVQFCDFDPNENPPYQTTVINAATVGAAGLVQEAVVQEVGIVVEVPLYLPPPNDIRITQINDLPGLPLGGPGGHLSLLFTTTDEGGNEFLLDATVPGLAAMAAPFYSRTFEFARNGAVADPIATQAEITAAVRASYPNADNVTVPDPELLYMVDDAAVPQGALEPMLNFSGITVEQDGETIILRDIAAPALEGGQGGIGPTVAITAPAPNSSFTPGGEVTLAGTIADGTPPYSYEWFNEEETLLAEGTLEQPGSVQATTIGLGGIGRDGEPIAATVILRVTDADGIVRDAQQSLTPIAPLLYLPTIRAVGGSTPGALQAAPFSPEVTQTSGHSFGVEGVWDYPPAGAGGSDLPGVIPDINGFRSGMTSYGYSQRFSWTNFAAWEKDWRDCSLGGGDCTYGVDRTDFVYYAGHGGPGGISLGSTKDTKWVDGANTRLQQARWVGFAACQTLRVQGATAGNEPIRRWFNAFRGAHMLLGFNSNMADIAFGGRLVDNMRVPRFFGIDFPSLQLSIRQAWVKTAFDMNAGKPAYIYARSATVNPADNKLPRIGTAMPPRPFPVTSYHWVWWNE
jgi:hypothetical protein